MVRSCAILFGFLFILSSPTGAAQTQLAEIENHLLEGGSYRLDQIFPGVREASMKEWPQEVKESIFLKLWQPGFSSFDKNDPSRFNRFPSPGYEFSGHIVRSMTARIDGQTMYIAVYFVIGGEIGRDQRFYEYYILDGEGELITSGRN